MDARSLTKIPSTDYQYIFDLHCDESEFHFLFNLLHQYDQVQ